MISTSINLENNKKLFLSNIYRSPHSTVEDNRNINNFFRSFGQLKHDHQVILGDFNRKSIDWVTAMSVSDDDCEFIEATRDSFLTQQVSTPTRGRGANKPSLIDLVFTSNEESIESINSFIKILFRCQSEKQVDKLVCNYVKADFKKMNEKLDINWDTFFEDCEDDVNVAWEMFLQKYNETERECIPRKVKTSRKRFSIPLDRKTVAKRKKKYRLWKRYPNTKDAKIYEEYCKCRNQLRRFTRKSVKSREMNIAKKVKTNNKLFWKFVSSKTKLKPSIADLFISSKADPNLMTNDDQTKSELLGKFFSSVFLKEPQWIWDQTDEDNP